MVEKSSIVKLARKEDFLLIFMNSKVRQKTLKFPDGPIQVKIFNIFKVLLILITHSTVVHAFNSLELRWNGKVSLMLSIKNLETIT